ASELDDDRDQQARLGTTGAQEPARQDGSRGVQADRRHRAKVRRDQEARGRRRLYAGDLGAGPEEVVRSLPSAARLSVLRGVHEVDLGVIDAGERAIAGTAIEERLAASCCASPVPERAGGVGVHVRLAVPAHERYAVVLARGSGAAFALE